MIPLLIYIKKVACIDKTSAFMHGFVMGIE